MLSSPAEIESIGLKYILEPFTNDIGEGREGVKWELGFAFFRGWEMRFWEWDFNLSNTGWDCGIELGFEKNNFLGNGIRTPPPPLHDPHWGMFIMYDSC